MNITNVILELLLFTSKAGVNIFLLKRSRRVDALIKNEEFEQDYNRFFSQK